MAWRRRGRYSDPFDVSSPRRRAAFLTNVELGILLLVIVFDFDARAAVMAVGGLVIVVVTSVPVRTGMIDVVEG